MAFELKQQMIFALIETETTRCTPAQLQVLHACIDRIEGIIKLSEYGLISNLPNVRLNHHSVGVAGIVQVENIGRINSKR